MKTACSLAILLLALVPAEAGAAMPDDIALQGVVLSRDVSHSVALLSAGGRSHAVLVGESVFGGRLLGLSADGALMDFGGQQVTLRLSSSGRPLPVSTPPQYVEDASPGSASEGPPVQHKMLRSDLDRRLGVEMNRILAETALKPVIEDGQVVGVAITRLARESVLTDVGLQAGDVITEINGTEIDGLATLMGLYSRLQSEKDLRAVVRRGGKSLRLELTLQ